MSSQPARPDIPESGWMRSARDLFGSRSADAALVAVSAAAIAALIGSLLTVRVSGTSMEPTLTPGDSLLADKVLIHWRAPARGDLVEMELPNGAPAVKRVIGLPGDVLEIDGSSSNGQSPRVLLRLAGGGPWQLLEETYLAGPWLNLTFCCDERGRATSSAHPFTVPADQYFVLGDNRNVSEDSRVLGPIDRSRILGRVMLRYWPPGRVQDSFPGPKLINAG